MQTVVGTTGRGDWAACAAAASRRDQVALARDAVARRRDNASRRRDQAARHRDEVAAGRDRDAMRRDQLARRRDDPPECVADRLFAARERIAAAVDRTHSADDRRAAARDRHLAALDRWHALVDRTDGAADREHASVELDRLSVDELTGLLRRRSGMARLELEVERAHRSDGTLAVAFVDVDGLKRTNDRDGHSEGDALLREVARALRTCMRPYDVLLRLGGDEFLCGMVDVQAEVAAERFEEVGRMLAQRGGSVSVGIAELRREDSAQALVDRADQALLELRSRRAIDVAGHLATRVRVREDIGA